MSASCVPDFLQVFRSRREYCRALLELSYRQMELISADDYSQLMVVLGQKQRLLGRMEEMKKGQPELWRQWHDRRDQLEPALRNECEKVLEETENVLAELVQREKEGTDSLTARRDQTREQLQTVSQGTQVNEAYRNSLAPASHRHLDVDQ